MEKRETEHPKRKEEEKEPLVSPIIAEDSRVMREQSGDGVPSDVGGSYTGTAIDGDRPIQDADDL